MKILIVFGLIILSLFLLSSCKSKYEDISHDGLHSHLIGREYVSLVPLVIYGITTGNIKDKKLDQYSVLDNDYGSSGPEVLSRGVLETNTAFKLIRALSCTNCPFERVKYQINLLSDSHYRDVDVPVYLKDRKNNIFIRDKDGKFNLYPKIFKQSN